MGTVTEPERLALRQWAGEHMNEEAAETLMDSLPPTGWDDLATKSDLKTLHAATKSDLTALDAKIDAKTEALETKIDTLGTVLTATFTAKLAQEIGEVHKQTGAICGSMRGQTITLVVTVVLALLGQDAMARFMPLPPPPPPQIIIQSPGQ